MPPFSLTNVLKNPPFQVLQAMRRMYGSISVDTLLEKKTSSDDDSLVLLDVRDPAEYSVSHLENAMNVPVYASDKQLTELVQNIALDADVVCYCLIGGRAAKLAERIEGMIEKQRGAPKPTVYLLEGSISAWALSGKPLVDCEGKCTRDVHLDRAPPALKQLFVLS